MTNTFSFPEGSKNSKQNSLSLYQNLYINVYKSKYWCIFILYRIMHLYTKKNFKKIHIKGKYKSIIHKYVKKKKKHNIIAYLSNCTL